MTAPYQPLDPATAGTIGSFDLSAIAKEMTNDDAFHKSGRVSRTLAHGDPMTAVLTVMRKGGELHEHAAPGPVIVTLLSGEVVFTFDEFQDDVTLRAGSTVIFSKDVAHRVLARNDSAFLIVIGGRKA